MFINSPKVEVARIIRQRIEEDHEVSLAEPTTLSQYMCEMTGIDLDKCEAMSWGEPVQFTVEEIETMAKCFHLNQQLLTVFLMPTSEEVIRETLEEVAATGLNECPECEHYQEMIAFQRNLQAEEVEEIGLSVLEHIIVGADFNGWYDEAELVDEDDQQSDQMASQLLRAFFSLDEQQQKRVLAYAYQEAAGTVADNSAPTFHAYSQLRQRYLSPLATNVFDTLSLSENGSMDRQQLLQRLQLQNGRSLGQLKRSVLQALGRMQRDGIELDGDPLLVSSENGVTIYSLNESTLRAWRALLRAETMPTA